ncbi:MAG: ABC transporter permease [Armatimonadota bacterium]
MRSGTARLGPALTLNIGAALTSLLGNAFRAALTVLGVVIGVASVIVLVAFGEGAQREITSQIDTLGASVSILVPGKMQGQANFNPMGGMGLSNITWDDVEAVRSVPGIRAAAPVTFIGGGVYRGEKAAEICMPIATTPEFQSIRRLTLQDGRFFTGAELERKVCILGKGIKQDLFGEEPAVGKEISINDTAYRVIGVAAERSIGSGMFGGDELDALIYLPFSAVEKQYGMSLIHRVFVDVMPDREPEAVLEQVRQTVLQQHGGRDDFSLLGAKELLSMFYRIFTLLASLLVGITSISLIVGGIGIMNVMLVSVTERTREIGIRKTVGARRRDIFFQFLTEAVVLSAVGGALGIGLAVLVCRLVVIWMPLQPVITGSSVALGFGVCVVVGILSGVIPAVAAARKDPIAAIRHE